MVTRTDKQRAPIGRPREFDAEAALEKAMLFFWEHGYEGASLAGLTKAMGISTTSMYAAFGNKEELFRKALQRYSEKPDSYLERGLLEPTAFGVASVVLNGVVRSTTQPEQPHGCLGVHSALVTGAGATSIRELLVEWRTDFYERLNERFQRAADEGDLPEGADPAVLARYLATLVGGIAVQAAGGVAREDLQVMADAALRTWPPR
ncbi:TetR/AcrR family transcriptional regulator [Kineosporia babensis]|uniref:TetR/AcrR family transcriptional regulator n=1 Tax=Kineosporia babensis TaxID=499548 RepID=A0A9X1STZ2_9ACTN|nr:TetR/AcrR family transcriptional regulator [Kineosporia babensis]MCD5311110.1 TetR/AcrR family transcriptional regulator [Kineosporia babensis]